MRTLIVFYKGYCGYCHKLINDPIEQTAAEHNAELLFIDAERLEDNPFRSLYDTTRGVPQTVLADVTPVAQTVGYRDQAHHSASLRGG